MKKFSATTTRKEKKRKTHTRQSVPIIHEALLRNIPNIVRINRSIRLAVDTYLKGVLYYEFFSMLEERFLVKEYLFTTIALYKLQQSTTS